MSYNDCAFILISSEPWRRPNTNWSICTVQSPKLFITNSMGATLNHRQHRSWDHSVAPGASHALSHVIFTMSLTGFLHQPEVAELPRAERQKDCRALPQTGQPFTGVLKLQCKAQRQKVTKQWLPGSHGSSIYEWRGTGHWLVATHLWKMFSIFVF